MDKEKKEKISCSSPRSEGIRTSHGSSSDTDTGFTTTSDEEDEPPQRNVRVRIMRRRRSTSFRRSSFQHDFDPYFSKRGRSFDQTRLNNDSNHRRWSDDHPNIRRPVSWYVPRRRTATVQIEETPPEPSTLLESSIFGIMPWYNRPNEPTEADKVLYQSPSRLPEHEEESLITFGNVLYTVLFGWMLALAYVIAWSVMNMTLIGKPYAELCWQLAGYYFFPFGKYLVRRGGCESPEKTSLEDLSLPPETEEPRKRFSEDGNDLEKRPLHASPSFSIQEPEEARVYCKPVVFTLWLIVGAFISVVHLLVMCLCWLVVFFIPMAKVNLIALQILLFRPLEVRVARKPQGNIVCCTYQAGHYLYYRYNAAGLNVVLLNLVSFVFLSLILGYVVPHSLQPPPPVLFTCCLLSIIPLAYYIGMSVASIANQTNFAIGAMLNALFGVSIEIILYGSAIVNGGLDDLVQAGVVGSLLGDLLLLPGLSMIFGGIKYKEQRFSPAVAGVSSVLLIISVIGVFTPTIYWLVAGAFSYDCEVCIALSNTTFTVPPMACTGCRYVSVSLDDNALYRDRARPLMYICAAVLPICYCVGLLFTLKTHSFIFENNSEEREEHHGPQWSTKIAAVMLAISVSLFALISEKAIQTIEPTLEAIGIEQHFAGLTIIALVPSFAEYVNAIGFALNNNVALSLEIGASSAVQISLLMVPTLVAISAAVNKGKAADSFTLIFPTFSFFAIIMSVIVVNYISVEGKANYFKGAIMVACYCLFISAFYFLSL